MKRNKLTVTGAVCVSLLTLTGCAAQVKANDNTASGTASVTSTGNMSSTGNGTANSTTSSSKSQSTQNTNSSSGSNPSSREKPTNHSGSPVEISGTQGGLSSNQSWVLKGSNATDKEKFSTNGFTIAGVHWTWPAKDTNPRHYIVVPTEVSGHPELVWCHIGSHVGESDSSAKPSQLWMTPWRKSGGSLQTDAQLITSDIPPIWHSESDGFPKNRTNDSPKNLAGSAWTGWFQWGQVSNPYSPKKKDGNFNAIPYNLYPAYNGIVLKVGATLQPNAYSTNLYYLNLSSHHIVGIASLPDGAGGYSASWRVVSGMVFTSERTPVLTSNGKEVTPSYVFNAYTGKHQSIKSPSSSSNGGTSGGFYKWSIKGTKIYNGKSQLVVSVKMPASAEQLPNPKAFGVSN